jgi:hypothetical protein
MKITNQAYKAKYKTKYNFGGLLPAGIKVNIVKEFEGNNVAVIDHQKNIWHGSKIHLESLNQQSNKTNF